MLILAWPRGAKAANKRQHTMNYNVIAPFFVWTGADPEGFSATPNSRLFNLFGNIVLIH